MDGMKLLEEQLIDATYIGISERLEYALRHLVTPPIKGEITRGKIKWRGLRVEQSPVDFEFKDGEVIMSTTIHLWQRDKMIF